MAVTACLATVCALTLAAIRWLAVLGVVRDYAATHTSGTLPPVGGGWGFTTSSFHRQLGLYSGPSAALTRLDSLTWKIGFLAAVFWMLRLGLRSASRRIGNLRGLGIMSGFALFVGTGVAHDVAEAVLPSVRARDAMHRIITLWCSTAVVSAVVLGLTHGIGAPTGTATLGDQAALAPIGWSIARNAVQLFVVVVGWWIAFRLTRDWVRADMPRLRPRAAQARVDA